MSTAPSPSCSSSGLRKASTKTLSVSAAEDLPPAPCASVITSSINRGRRLRNSSILSSIRFSRSTCVVVSAVMSVPPELDGPAAIRSATRRRVCSWTTDQSRYPTRAWLSWIRWMLWEWMVKQ